MASYHLSCSWEIEGEVVVMRPEGYLNDQTEREFEGTLREAARDSQRIVIDASGLIHVSSIGFGTLLAVASDLRRGHGDLRIAALNPSLTRALTLVFGPYFRLFETVPEAVRSFDAVAAG
ncbi:putative anti-sigma factor antagonist [compost metagenome]